MAGRETPHRQVGAFLRAVLAELRIVVEQDRRHWTVKSHLPVVPHAAQLNLLGLLLLKGIKPSDRDVSPHRAKLEDLLGKAYTHTKDVWAESLTKTTTKARDRVLNDNKTIAPAVMRAVNFADREFSLSGLMLDHFLTNVQDSLAALTGKLATVVELKMSPGDAKGTMVGVPPAVHGVVVMASLAGGLAGRRVMTAKEATVARIAVRLGSKRDETGGPEPKPVKKLRKSLKELAQHLPEQRA